MIMYTRIHYLISFRTNCLFKVKFKCLFDIVRLCPNKTNCSKQTIVSNQSAVITNIIMTTQLYNVNNQTVFLVTKSHFGDVRALWVRRISTKIGDSRGVFAYMWRPNAYARPIQLQLLCFYQHKGPNFCWCFDCFVMILGIRYFVMML